MENKTELDTLVQELKDAVAAKTTETAEAKAQIEVLETGVKTLEEKVTGQDEASKAIAESSNEFAQEVTELKETVKLMEKKLYRSAGATDTPNAEEVKDFTKFLRTNDTKYLRTDRDPDGGYLVPQELHDQIINKIIETSDLRRLATVKQISSKSLDVDTRENDMTVFWVGEGASATESNPDYGQIQIMAHKVIAENRITHELLADAAFDMVQELNVRAGQKFAQKEGAAFINGTGVNEPEGLLQATGTTNVNSGNATKLTADAFFDMLGEFKYRNPVFLMNRKTFSEARQLKDGSGAYLLQGGMDGNFDMRLGGNAGMIAGVPVVLMQDMPDVGAGNKAVILLDPQVAYMIVDRVGMRIIRDDYTLASEDKVKFVMSRRVGGAVVNPDAVITMTVSV